MWHSPEYGNSICCHRCFLFSIDLVNGTNRMRSHICRDLWRSRRTRTRTPLSFGRACTWTATLTSDTSGSRFVRSCPSVYKWAVERDISHRLRPPTRRTHRCAALNLNQQRCLTPCPPCASWDLSPSPPPATSRTAPEEGNERCRRAGSDRWGPAWFLLVLGCHPWVITLEYTLYHKLSLLVWGKSNNI